MNFTELNNLFESYTGTEGEVESSEFAVWLNEAQLDLAYDFGTVEKWMPEENETGAYPLPEDCLVLIEADKDFYYLPNGDISFYGSPGNMYYIKYPAEFTGLESEQVSELPPAIHNLMAMFAASRYWDGESEGDGEESAHATKWMSYYLQGKAQAKSRLQTRGSRVTEWRVI